MHGWKAERAWAHLEKSKLFGMSVVYRKEVCNRRSGRLTKIIFVTIYSPLHVLKPKMKHDQFYFQ